MAIENINSLSEVEAARIQKEKLRDMINTSDSRDSSFVVHNEKSPASIEGFNIGKSLVSLSLVNMASNTKF